MRLPFILVLGGVIFSENVLADDLAAGRQVANMCRTCHGIDGYAAIPIAPHIGGEAQEYLEAQLWAFKTGARENEMMTVVASSLSEEQIKNVSAWYAAHEVVATLPAGVTAEDAPLACSGCHGADGVSVFPDAPNLAGETNIYIDTQLKAYKRGLREHEIMTYVAEELSDAKIREIANWFASIKLEITPIAR